MFIHGRKVLACIALLFLMAGCAVAPPSAAPAQDDSRPSEESVKTLLEVSEVRKTVDGILDQSDGIMKTSFQNAFKGKALTPDQQKICDASMIKVQDMLRQELSWDSLEPMYVRIYSDSLTQSEVDGMIAFYRTPAGHAYVEKMPIMMRNTMKEMQARMGPMSERIQKITQETAAELKADAAKKVD